MEKSIMNDLKKAKKPKLKTLQARENDLAQPNKQLAILNGGLFADGELPYFKDKISEIGQFPLRPNKLEILQINVGYMCNITCEHCHVDAGPTRKEIMTVETMEQCLEVIRNTGAHTLDLTGGAPEMNPNFRWFVEEAPKLVLRILSCGLICPSFWPIQSLTTCQNSLKNTMYTWCLPYRIILVVKPINSVGMGFLTNR